MSTFMASMKSCSTSSKSTRYRRLQAVVNEHFHSIKAPHLTNVKNTSSVDVSSLPVAYPALPNLFQVSSGEELDLNQSATLSTDDDDINFDLNENLSISVDDVPNLQDISLVPCIREGLADWAVQYKISHSALSSLQALLRSGNVDVPLDPRTLLSTPRQANIQSLAGGSYYHFGIENSIRPLLKFKELNNIECITLRINIDGLPLFNSRPHSLWPILASIKQMPQKVFMIGVYYGAKKPSPVQDFLHQFVQDMTNIVANGIDFEGKHFNFEMPDAFICDAPARAYVKCVKGHGGYYGCERCIQPGVHIQSRQLFLDINSPLRTDEQFENMSQREHHTGESPLKELQIGLVSTFVLDYMHLVCLGVVRKLVFLWTKGPLTCRMSATRLKVISDKLIGLRSHLPREFSRKPRCLTEYKQWKATEFRQFLLYTGPVVLQHELPSKLYRNFMLLSVSVRFLLTPGLCQQYSNYVEELLKTFVKNFRKIYGKTNIIYNIHNLVHLVDDARRYGPLDSVSCFPFENFLGQLKKFVRRPQDPLSQIVRRVAENQRIIENQASHTSCRDQSQTLSKPHLLGPLPAEMRGFNQFHQYNSSSFFVSCSIGNNCFKISEKIVLIRNILQSSEGQVHIVCENFRTVESAFQYPIDWADLGVCRIKQLSGRLFTVPVEEISFKLVRLPLQQWNIILPLMHGSDC